MAKSKKSKKSLDSKNPVEKKEEKEQKQQDDLTWQQIAEARKPVAQKAIELLDDPTKHLIVPKEEVMIEKEIKFKTQPTPTHTIVTELSPPRRITQPAATTPPKKVLKSEIKHQETRTLTPEEVDNLKKGMQQLPTENEDKAEDDLIKSVKEAAQKLLKVFHKKKPE